MSLPQAKIATQPKKTPTPVVSLPLSRRFTSSSANCYAFIITTEAYLSSQRRNNTMSHPHQEKQGHLVFKGTHHLLLGLLIGTLLLSGGGNIDRSLVEMPAWQHVGALAWATFSQWADLSRGLLIYPVQAIGSAILCITAALIVFRKRRNLGCTVALPISVALLFAFGVLLTTTQAAPAMLSTSSHLSDPAALQQSLNTFTLWQGIRSVCGWLESCALIWTLVAVARSSPM
jgi:hypothetical protein